ncbi:MAG TPA: PQQ-dependent sugar dehydrogenase, partial [Saprospiraceae bacterium]|nr:PQQ-dependent sugar dehydrogenase [Saprospiraceae bacterium]
NRVSRFTAVGNYALPDSEVILFELDEMSGTIHNGGAMAFGLDGKLYLSAGDGANSGNAQNLNTTLGKILRINPDGSIPTDNPFYNDLNGNNRAIWAYGFRNSYTFAIQPGTGLLFANDVGGGDFEEVNDIRAGRNYGWDIIEGNIAGQVPPPNYQDPVFAYSHDFGCAVIGAAFYNPTQYQFPPQYHGKYFFGDYCQGFILVLDPVTGEVTQSFATGIERPVALLTAPDGSMYYLERRGIGGGSQVDNTSTNNGVLWRIFYTGSGAPFVSSQPQSLLLPVGEDAHFTVTASGAPELMYQWQKDGADIPGANAAELMYPSVGLADDGSLFRCRVQNAEGTVFSELATLSVTANTRPMPSLLLPEMAATYRAGDTIFFSGLAMDAEEGLLGADQLIWRIDFHHDTHTHPALTPISDISEGFYVVPVVGETDDNVWYRVYLSATDSEGLSQTVHRDVFPEKLTFSVQTEPSGLSLRIDGQSVTTPFEATSVVGLLRTITAPTVQLIDHVLYTFTGWSDGTGNPVYPFIAENPGVSFTALYDAIPLGTGIGLTGAYYDEVEHVFEGLPAFWRIDPTVDYDWGHSSAAPTLIGEDFFSIRWTGAVEPYFSDEYTFYVRSDDGIRLWVDEQLLIDQWVPQAATETSASIFLEQGNRYPIRLEYFEDGGEAVCQLLWSSDRIVKEVIPSTQLYPEFVVESQEQEAASGVKVYPNPFADGFYLVCYGDAAADYTFRLFDVHGRVLWQTVLPHFAGRTERFVPLADLTPGLYLLEIADGENKWLEKVVKF